jgi:hypothetical protein
MRILGQRQLFLILISSTNVEAVISKFSLRISKYLPKYPSQVSIAFLISFNSKFGFLSAKLNKQVNSNHVKIKASLYAISLLFLNYIRFLIVKLVILVEQYRLSPNYRVSHILPND